MKASITSDAIGCNLPDFNLVSWQNDKFDNNDITVNHGTLNCAKVWKNVLSHTYSLHYVKKKLNIIRVQQHFYLQKRTNKLDNESMIPKPDSSQFYCEMQKSTASILKMAAIFNFRWQAGQKSNPQGVCMPNSVPLSGNERFLQLSAPPTSKHPLPAQLLSKICVAKSRQ